MISRFILHIIILSGLISFSSCGKKNLSRDAYSNYVSDDSNGLLKKENFDGITVELLYQPLEYVYLKERKESEISKMDFDVWKKDKINYEFYILRLRSEKANEISQHEAANFGEYSQYLDYFVSDFQNDIIKVVGPDTLPCELYHYERNFGISANNNFNLVFNKSASKEDKTIIINLGVYELGNIKFKFKKEDIDNLPSLAFGV
jgi:hypothetical protein